MSVPVIELAGSDTWRNAYDIGSNLEEAFPGQDGQNLAFACEYNGWGLVGTITGLLMIEQGEHDGASWKWLVTSDNKHYLCVAWCDFTGWDCQSGASWTDFAPGFDYRQLLKKYIHHIAKKAKSTFLTFDCTECFSHEEWRELQKLGEER